jgi:hypothetical protein
MVAAVPIRIKAMKSKYEMRLICRSPPLKGTFRSNVKLLDLERLKSVAIPRPLAEMHHTASSGAV